jgi:hypothetical protein
MMDKSLQFRQFCKHIILICHCNLPDDILLLLGSVIIKLKILCVLSQTFLELILRNNFDNRFHLRLNIEHY